MRRNNVNFGGIQFNELLIYRTKTKEQKIVSHDLVLNKLINFFQIAGHPTLENTRIKTMITITPPTTNHQENHLSTFAPESTCTCVLIFVESWTWPIVVAKLF